MLAALAQGWGGLALAYGAVQLPLLVGLHRGGARWHHYVLSPLVAAPLTVVAGAGAVAAGLAWGAVTGSASGWLTAAASAALGARLGFAAGRSAAAGEGGGDRHRRGTRLEERGPPRSRPGTGEIRIGDARVPVHDEAKHFKLIGSTGTGKSTAIRQILATALARGDRAVIADPDGGYTARFHDAGRGDVILNPFDPRSRRWDLFAEIDNDYDIEQLARSLIPDHEGAERSWRGYARTFFTAVTRQARDAGVGDTAELYRLLVIAEPAELRTLLGGTPAQPFLDEHNSRMFDSIRSVTSSAVAPLEHVAAQSAAGFSVRRWVREESPGVLFMPYKAGQIAALRSVISAWMRLAIFETMDREELAEVGPAAERRRLWFVVDELDALGQIDGLKDALARLRKFGGRCVLGLQSIAQVSSTYGHDEAHTLVENCGNTLILRCSASEGGGTARFASQLIGEREVTRLSTAISRRPAEWFGTVTRSEQTRVEPAVLPSQIEQLADLTGYFKQASDPRWQRVRLDARRIWEDRGARVSAAPGAAARRGGVADLHE